VHLSTHFSPFLVFTKCCDLAEITLASQEIKASFAQSSVRLQAAKFRFMHQLEQIPISEPAEFSSATHQMGIFCSRA
jgi:hypothetical protein